MDDKSPSMKLRLLTVLLLLLSIGALAENVSVTPLKLPEGSNTGEISGNISTGQIIPMRWAESSAVALVPATRFEQFNGNQLFYQIELPAASNINIKLMPKDGKKINLYALRQSAQSELQVPPNVTSAISSEASYPKYANLGSGRKVQNRDKGYREVEFMSVDRPYNILIGVAGAEGATEGDFFMRIEITGR